MSLVAVCVSPIVILGFFGTIANLPPIRKQGPNIAQLRVNRSFCGPHVGWGGV